MFYVLELIIMLGVILLASQLFTNALEHFAHRAGISTGVTGSILAAVATALPEATVPLVAVIAGTKDSRINQDIAVGAILGAPLMLSTLSIFLMSLFALKHRGIKSHIVPENSGLKRDLNFFLGAFLLAVFAMILPFDPLYFRALISIALVSLYVFYIFLTLKSSKKLVAEGHSVTLDESLLLSKMGLKESKIAIAIQLMIGVALLILGAKGFVSGVEGISTLFQVSALLVSLLIIPVATELPEKINSILWVLKRKDTLAVGNITGAMVFQGTLLPALGVFFIPWQPNKIVLSGIVITLIAAAWLRLNAVKQGLSIAALLINGLLYLAYAYLVL